jgi:hypothetical protein
MNPVAIYHFPLKVSSYIVIFVVYDEMAISGGKVGKFCARILNMVAGMLSIRPMWTIILFKVTHFRRCLN